MTSLALHAGLLAATATTTKSGKSSGSSLLPLAFLAVAFLALYFLVLRPRKQRMQAQRKAQVAGLELGSEVMSVGGIMGTIVAVGETTYDVEVAPGVVLTFVHRAVNNRPASAGSGVADAEPVDSDDLPPDPWDDPPPPPEEEDDSDEAEADHEPLGHGRVEAPGGAGEEHGDGTGAHPEPHHEPGDDEQGGQGGSGPDRPGRPPDGPSLPEGH